MAADCAMLPGAHAMTVVAALAKCYRAGARMLGHPLCRFLAFAIVPNCGGSGEKRLSCFTEHCGCEFAFKGVTYETLTNPTFQEGVRKAYARGDFDKPFYDV